MARIFENAEYKSQLNYYYYYYYRKCLHCKSKMLCNYVINRILPLLFY
jgi:hypothetical protein